MVLSCAASAQPSHFCCSENTRNAENSFQKVQEMLKKCWGGGGGVKSFHTHLINKCCKITGIRDNGIHLYK